MTELPYRFTIGQIKEGYIELHPDFGDELGSEEYAVVIPLEDFNTYRNENKVNTEMIFEFLEMVKEKSLYDIMVIMKQLKEELDESK
ncbi:MULTISPECIES: hypothetical protein [Methanobacterium]|jgi:hypothetical protein|uniref:Uncharacterized protein n=1 Tax=Methanobacterium veterum TaxID=408577 RepID=A0A9E5A220_9EURY|nr:MULTISPECIES: hypothetical protein [Methanobacterium]MCZ3366675.1 hypothetical protein [Methanobacterium veterum]MCZ3374180.1 hypothetical protein [Methanobacterium veterum]